MKKISFNIILMLCTSVLFMCSTTGCNDNIDLEAEGIISADGFFKSSDDFDKALNRLYSRMNYDNNDLWMDGSTDDGLTTHSWNRGYEYGHNISTPSSSFFSNKWNNGYKDIQWANTIINSIDNCEWSDQTKKNNYIGQAKAFRAYLYLNMVSMFGHILFYTENPTLSTASDVPQMTDAAGIKKVFDFVLSELDEAISDLPATPSNKCMWSKNSARLLRARAASYAAGYLNDKSYYQTTLSETKDLVNISLASDFASLFTYDNEGFDEVLMIKSYSSDSKNSWGNWYNQSISGYCVTSPVKSLVDAFEYVKTPNDLLPYEGKEPRFYNTVYAPGMVIRGMYYNTIPNNVVEKSGSYYFDPSKEYGAYQDLPVRTGDVLSEGGGSEWNKTPTGFTWKKYHTETETWNTTNSYIIFRATEAYLLRAEAIVETGGSEAEAKALVKAVRDRGGNTNPIDETVTSLYGGSLLNLIRNEFRVEFAHEGLRFFDIRRWGEDYFINAMNVPVRGVEWMNGGQKKYIEIVNRTFTSKEYWWPIPQDEMDLSTDGRIQQNPGW